MPQKAVTLWRYAIALAHLQYDIRRRAAVDIRGVVFAREAVEARFRFVRSPIERNRGEVEKVCEQLLEFFVFLRGELRVLFYMMESPLARKARIPKRNSCFFRLTESTFAVRTLEPQKSM